MAASTIADIAAYVVTIQPVTPLAGPPRTAKLIMALVTLAVAVVALSVAIRRLGRQDSSHRMMVASWSLGYTATWGVLYLFLFLVYYPLPYHSHHIDRFLLLSAVLLLWSVALALWPRGLAVALNGKLYGWIKIALVNMLVFLAIGEVTLRALDPFLARSGLFGGKHTPADLTPHAKVLGSIGFSNSQGFRDRERTFERTSSAPRIIALGDSFTWGAGVTYDETFVTLLERALQTSSSGAEVINLGVPGWEPPEELHLLKAYGVKFQPDLVLLNFFAGNDLMRRRGVYLETPMIVAGQSYYVHTTGRWLHDTLSPDRWHLYHHLNYTLKVGMNRLQRAEAAKKHEIGLGVPWKPRREYLRDIDERSEVYLKEDTPLFEHHWKRSREALDAMRRFLQDQGIPLMLVLIPAQEQLDHALQVELMTALGTSPDRYDFEKPQRLLVDYALRNGLVAIDLLPVFKQHGDPSQMFFENDMHWKANGHARAAAGILPVLNNYLQSRRPPKQ